MQLDWNEKFISIAYLASLKSRDPYRKVGAVCVSRDNRILSTGYNGIKAGIDYPEDYFNDRENPSRSLLTIHAEANSIDFVEDRTKIAKIYTTCSPCIDCAKKISQSNIQEVFYLEEWHRDTRFKEIFCFYNIQYSQLKVPPIFRDKLNVDFQGAAAI